MNRKKAISAMWQCSGRGPALETGLLFNTVKEKKGDNGNPGILENVRMLKCDTKKSESVCEGE